MRLLTASDYRRMRWKNGLGWTTEIAVWPEAATEDYDWRASIAEIETDCAFSSFPGCERSLLLLHGGGIELSFDQAAAVTLHPGDRPARFAGEWQTSCRLLDGATRDFNVISRRQRVAAEVLRRPLIGSMWFHAGAQTQWLLHMLAGSARITGSTRPLESGESLLLTSDSGHRLLDGGGDLLVVKFTAASAVNAEE